jgi:3-methyl-2-oxobutanoate hydroxymethyltransferase
MLKEGGARAVKVEGGSREIAETISAIRGAGIPVMGHIGFTPQAVHALGGSRVQGRGEIGRFRLLEEAARLQDAGAF